MIRDLPARLPEVGRIRLGTRVRTRTGRLAPARSDTLIYSSPSRGTLSALAARVGGAVEDWSDGPEPYRLVSERDAVPVMVPRDFAEAWWELWSGAGCLRRCDGVSATVPEEDPTGSLCLVERPCLCGEERECKPTTRLRVVLPEVPGIGIWLATTHSVIAAQELPAQVALLAASDRALLRATLAIEQEQTRKGRVPVVRLRFHEGVSAVASDALPALPVKVTNEEGVT